MLTPRFQPTSLSSSSTVRSGFIHSSISSSTAGRPRSCMPPESHLLKVSESLALSADTSSERSSRLLSSDLCEPLPKQTADLLFVRDPLINQPQEPAHLYLPAGCPELAPPLKELSIYRSRSFLQWVGFQLDALFFSGFWVAFSTCLHARVGLQVSAPVALERNQPLGAFRPFGFGLDGSPVVFSIPATGVPTFLRSD